MFASVIPVQAFRGELFNGTGGYWDTRRIPCDSVTPTLVLFYGLILLLFPFAPSNFLSSFSSPFIRLSVSSLLFPPFVFHTLVSLFFPSLSKNISPLCPQLLCCSPSPPFHFLFMPSSPPPLPSYYSPTARRLHAITSFFRAFLSPHDHQQSNMIESSLVSTHARISGRSSSPLERGEMEGG